MAKIGSLAVGNIKLKNGSLTHFVIGGGASITVANDSGNPTFIWVESASGNVTLTRADGTIIFQGSGYVRSVAADPSPPTSTSYSVNTGLIRGASFRWR